MHDSRDVSLSSTAVALTPHNASLRISGVRSGEEREQGLRFELLRFNVAELVQIFAAVNRPDKPTSDFLASLHPDVYGNIRRSDVCDDDIANPTVVGLFWKLIGLAAAAYNSPQTPYDTLKHASCEVRTKRQTMTFSPLM